MADDAQSYREPHSCVLLDCVLDASGARLETADDPAAAVRWRHIDALHPAAAERLAAQTVPAAIIDTLLREETRPRALAFDGGLAINLRGINRNPDADPEDMVSIRLWVTAGSVISCRMRRVMAVEELVAAAESGSGPVSSGALVVQLVALLADRVGEFVGRLDERLALLEETAASGSDPRAVLDLRRQTATVRRFLAPQRDALDGLLRLGRELLNEAEWFALREQVDRTARYIEDLELLRERTLVLQETYLQQAAQVQNQRMYSLSLAATVFLPLGFLTGLFGVNLAGIPGAENPWGFALLCVGLGLAAAGLFAALRIGRWF